MQTRNIRMSKFTKANRRKSQLTFLILFFSKMRYALLGKTMKLFYTMDKMLAFWECGVLVCLVCCMGPRTHKTSC